MSGPEFIHSEKGMRNVSDGTVVMDRHLYLTEDKARVVEEGDPAGRWLWASPGQEVSRRDAERLGAIKPEPAAKAAEEKPEPAKDEPEAEPDEKAQKPAANKQRGKPENK